MTGRATIWSFGLAAWIAHRHEYVAPDPADYCDGDPQIVSSRATEGDG